jgi:hypothetical protein
VLAAVPLTSPVLTQLVKTHGCSLVLAIRTLAAT